MRALLAVATALLLNTVGAASPAVSGVDSGSLLDLRVGARPYVDASFPADGRQASPAELRRGKVRGVLMPLIASGPNDTTAQLAVRLAALRRTLSISGAFDTRGCAASGPRIAVWFELDAPDSLAEQPAQVVTWMARGVRVFALVGQRDNAVATSAFASAPEQPYGLTPKGRALVSTILEAGGLLDVSNLSDAAFLEVAELARAARSPLLATRASARAVLQRPGSLSDWQLRAIAETGGVIGISFDRGLVGGGAEASLADLVRHIEHVRRVAGARAVALGSSFDTGSIPVSGLENAARLPRLGAAVARRGLSAEAMRGLLHDNARRVLCTPPAPAP